MPAKTYKKVGGTWTWYKLKKVYKKVGGTWQVVHTGTIAYTFTSSITASTSTGILLSSYVNPALGTDFKITVNSGVILSGMTGVTGATCGAAGTAGGTGIDFSGFSGKNIIFINNGIIKGGNGGNGATGCTGITYSSGDSCCPGACYSTNVGGPGGAGGAGGTGGPWTTTSAIPSLTINGTVINGSAGATGATGATGTCLGGGGCGSCFLHNSKVKLADNSIQNLADVKIGEKVIGAFGEINTVIAKEQVKLAGRKLYNINNEHYTTDEHPHITTDKKFYAVNVANIYTEWGGKYPCIVDNAGTIKLVHNKGLNKGRVKEMHAGITLQTVNGGKELTSLIAEDSNEEYVYNLIVDGSHTYTVDDYAVTSFPREDDFDYDKWQQKDRKLTILDYI